VNEKAKDFWYVWPPVAGIMAGVVAPFGAIIGLGADDPLRGAVVGAGVGAGAGAAMVVIGLPVCVGLVMAIVVITDGLSDLGHLAKIAFWGLRPGSWKWRNRRWSARADLRRNRARRGGRW
jgi:hypothetical protein